MVDRAICRIIGESEPMRELRDQIRRAGPLRLPVVIEGPTGAGKELVARALHDSSGRSGRFVAVNVCALAESMFEAMLFGYVRGAFTGAIRGLPGYLAEADRGTLFLDEIGGLAAAHQKKLLRAIETQEFRPMGSRVDCRSDFRVIVATNEPIDSLVTAGHFRADLYYRLAGMVLTVPPLRDRVEDIPSLVSHFVREAAAADAIVQFTTRALTALQEHDWPGNVRELRHVVERAVALSTNGSIHRSDVLRVLTPCNGNGGVCGKAGSRERTHLVEVLESCQWDTAQAAARLGVARSTVYRRMERLGIHA